MILLKINILLLVLMLGTSCTSQKSLYETPIGLINQVSYQDSSFDNANASNGFLIHYDGKDYAVTAKHILMIAKSDNMQFVDFEGELKEWRMQPKDDESQFVVMDKLLNPNQTDSLSWDYMFDNWDTWHDWIIFSIKENNSKHKPLKLRTSPIIEGENLYAVGWSYSDTTGSQRVYEYTYEDTEGNYHNLVQVKGPTSLGGLSGSPVVDGKGELVGLVTSGGEDEDSGKVYLQATSTVDMIHFLNKLKH